MEQVTAAFLVALSVLWMVLWILSLAQRWKQRQPPLPRATTFKARQERRWQLLAELYRLTGGSTTKSVRKSDLRRLLRWSKDELNDVSAFLIEAELVKIHPGPSSDSIADQLSWLVVYGMPLRLTPAGVQEVEQASTQPDPVEHLTNVTIHGDYSQVQVGTYHSQQEQIVDSLLLEHRTDIEAFLHGYQQAIDQLSDRDRLIAVDKLAAAEAQLYSARPSPHLLREALRSLRSIAEGVTGNAMFLALVELSKHFL